MRREFLIPCILFLAAFTCALLGLNPTFYLDDSPETVTAGVTLGIPHPPGYPLYTLLSRIICSLPVSHAPFRVNLLSALTASAVVLILFLFLERVWKLRRPLAAALAFFWIAGFTTYPAALSAKSGIYHLTALFLVGILFSILKRHFLLCAFLFGMALGNHWMSMVAYAPGLLYLGYAVSREEPPDRKDIFSMGALLMMGLSLYLILPLRAVLQPELNWGDPQSWGNFNFNFFRAQYKQAEGTGNLGVWLRQWVYYLKNAAFEFPGLLPTAILGGILAWRRDRPRAKGLLLTWGGLVAAVGIYLNLKPDKYHLIDAYAISSQLFLILFTAWAAVLWVRDAPEESVTPGQRKGREKWALLLALLLLIPSVSWRLVRQRQDRYTFSYDYDLNVWRSLPRGSLFFARGDSIVFPSWYFQWVEKRRPDLAVIGVDGLPMKWVRVTMKRSHPELKVPFPEMQVPFVGNESIAPMTRFLYYSNETRERYFSYNKIEDNSVPEVRLIPYGLGYLGVLPPIGVKTPPIDAPKAYALWRVLRLRNLSDHGASQDLRTRENLIKDYAVIRNGLGVYYEDLADEAKATAERTKKPVTEALLAGLYQNCYSNFRWASDWAPDDHEFTFNVGNALYNLGRTVDSTVWYERSTRQAPEYANAFYNWGVAEYQLGNYQKAGQLFDEVLRLEPERQEADKALQYLMFQGWYRRPKSL